jgi:hypothetical protein
MTDKLNSDEWSLARMYHLSGADEEILELCQRIMISRHEAAWIGAREETHSGEECQKLMDRRLELYDQIDADMGALEGYDPESLYTAHRILEVVLDVLAQRLIDSEGWLSKGPIDRLVVRVSDIVCCAAGAEAARKRQTVLAVPIQGTAA